MGTWRILWREPGHRNGYLDEIDAQSLAAAVWTVATTQTAAHADPAGNLLEFLGVLEVVPENPPADG